MVFSSIIFIFMFLPGVIITYYFCPKRWLFLRNLILLLFSLLFYYYGESKYTLVMIASIALNYIFGILIDAEHKKCRKGTAWVAVSVVVNLAILIYFKYLTFITENINSIFNIEVKIQSIVLPIGISFFTFQGMSYIFSVYNKKVDVQRNIFNLALYISMFPQLIAGPIVRYETVAEEIEDRTVNFEKFSQGTIRFIYGLAKKIIIANSMGLIADEVFSIPVDSLSAGLAWIGAIAYSFQIFYDFSGYSDMAIGLGMIFGFTFLENFNYPYISRTITEFWRRWHISLGSWFRDYLYIPLGGSRVKPARHFFNIFIVWLLTGFWHGASWNFIVWGLYFAVILIIEKTFLMKLLSKTWRFISHLYALLLIVIGWVIFRSNDLGFAIQYLKQMFRIPSLFDSGNQAVYYLTMYRFEWIAAIVFSVPVAGLLTKLAKKHINRAEIYIVRFLFVFILFILSIIYLVNTTFNPFIYFRF